MPSHAAAFVPHLDHRGVHFRLHLKAGRQGTEYALVSTFTHPSPLAASLVSCVPYNFVLVRFESFPKSLFVRVCALVVLFSIEALIAPLFRGHAPGPPPDGAWLTELVHASAASVARFTIAFAVLFTTFAWLRYRGEIELLAIAAIGDPIRPRLAALHLAAIGLFFLVSPGVYGNVSARASNLSSLLWLIGAVIAATSAAFALVPWKTWIAVLRSTGRLWMYSVFSAALICGSIAGLRMLWRPVSHLTFQLVALFLQPFNSNLVIQPDALRIGTHRFTVVIENPCSGLEGIGLLIVFAAMWLFLFREEARFPQALALIPLGIVTLFVLNAVRLTALILIGDAGSREIAMEGFHSQAGWIMFNSVAFGSAVAARHWSWVSVRTARERRTETAVGTTNLTAAFLMPFLAILAAGMLSRAMSGSFEWLYPLRFFAAFAAVWFFRRSYSRLDWNWSLLAPASGIAVFLLWIAAERLTGHPAPMPAALAAAPGTLRYLWIGLRILGAVVTVPLAEELAFRGFLMRRWTAEDFDSVPLRSAGWRGLLGSSLLFGLMHGQRWIVGSLSGVVFGLVAKKTGRIGQTVLAHAFANGLLAIFVLRFNAWQLW